MEIFDMKRLDALTLPERNKPYQYDSLWKTIKRIVFLLLFILSFLHAYAEDTTSILDSIKKTALSYCKEQNMPMESYGVTAVFLYWRGSLIQYDNFFGKKFEKIPTTYEQKDILIRFDPVAPELESFCLLLPTDPDKKQKIVRLKIEKTPKLPKEAMDIFSASKDPFEPVMKVFDAMGRIDKPMSDFSTKEISGICLLYDKDQYFGEQSVSDLEKDVLKTDGLKWIVTTEKDNTLFAQKKPVTLGGSYHFYINASSYATIKWIGFK